MKKIIILFAIFLLMPIIYAGYGDLGWGNCEGGWAVCEASVITSPTILGSSSGGSSFLTISKTFVKSLDELKTICYIDIQPQSLTFSSDNDVQDIRIRNLNPTSIKTTLTFVDDNDNTAASSYLLKNFNDGALFGTLNISILLKTIPSSNKYTLLKFDFENCNTQNISIPISIESINESQNNNNIFTSLNMLSIISLPTINKIKSYFNKNILINLKIPFIKETINLKNYIVLSIIFLISLLVFNISISFFFQFILFVIMNIIPNFIINLFV
ncbi:hypothetical protein HY498_05025 [Candidatus Woesearchaeota archaeon]|nr:hypothetical protein [Candidatus Woesearchaeota archaeon]